MVETTVKERNSGERHRIVDIVDLLTWWLAGPFKNMPPAIATLDRDEQQRRWDQIDLLVRHQGLEFLRGLADRVSARKARGEGVDINDPSATDQPVDRAETVGRGSDPTGASGIGPPPDAL